MIFEGVLTMIGIAFTVVLIHKANPPGSVDVIFETQLTCTLKKEWCATVEIMEDDTNEREDVAIARKVCTKNNVFNSTVIATHAADGLFDDWLEFVLSIEHTCSSENETITARYQINKINIRFKRFEVFTSINITDKEGTQEGKHGTPHRIEFLH